VAPSLFTALLAVDGRAPWAVLALTSALAAALLIRTERHLPADAVRPVAETVVRKVSPLASPHSEQAPRLTSHHPEGTRS